MMYTAKMAHYLFYIGDMVEQAVKHTNLQQIKINLEQDAEAEKLRRALFTKFAEENEQEPDVSYRTIPDDEK